MIRDAVTCDREGCLALCLEPLAAELDFEQHLHSAGWTLDDQAGHACPGCEAGRGPVLERGECPCCTGRTVDLPDGARCLYCRTTTPHPDEL